jgi:hypothetical protein
MACCGQFSTQVRQLMHSDMFTGSAFPPSTLNTDWGQTFAQVPSPSHFAVLIVTMYMGPESSSIKVNFQKHHILLGEPDKIKQEMIAKKGLAPKEASPATLLITYGIY